MAQNTAREIFVKKFLEPNPFLVGWSPNPQEARRESYLNAELRFDDPVESGQAAAGEGYRPAPSPQRYAVLSSGGKESLLSFGLLRELGCGVIPIFVNESGRHWFTAMNAYRHFSANIPETSKVWTNADRVFNWMLKHLPFVRKDHAKIRSDEYPIRLWTVAVFLFGALPLVFAKGCRFLVVGDEYDTTRRASFRGIPHYDGLYDQSRYFDEALTRFFHRKGWGISQFSILRPLSELLVQKILYERYPDLQRLQTSCHAARRQREGVRPCGRCEKCRRVVGMLLAVGGDPGTCGYDQRQTSDCLRMLVAGGAHQEARVVEHTGFLLRSSGHIQAEGLGRVRARQRPEVLGIRFDPERSPVDLMPVELREPLLRIWMSHASGVWLKSGRRWIDFDPLKDPSFSRPYRFDNFSSRRSIG
jgi:hypothetical protein